MPDGPLKLALPPTPSVEAAAPLPASVETAPSSADTARTLCAA